MPSQPMLPAPGTRQTLTELLYFWIHHDQTYFCVEENLQSSNSRPTLSLLKVGTSCWGKKKQGRIHNKPLLTQVVHALYNRNQSLLEEF